MKTILVIDDDAGFRGALASILRSQEWTVFEAGDGDSAIALARQHRPRAILCDLLMPGTNGFRVCAAIRGEHTLRYSLLIAMSGRDFDDTRQSAYEAGADEFLAKPIEMNRLIGLLHGVSGDRTPDSRGFDTAELIRSRAPFVRFWGVRGSVPVPGRSTVRYGGNTSCIEVRAEGEIVILDCGTGIRELGDQLIREFDEKPLNLTLLISHSHWDHVQGFPFFQPAYEKQNRICVFGFEGGRDGLAGVFSGQMESPYFPIGLGQLPGNIVFEELKSMEFNIGKIAVRATFANHPGVCAGYRLDAAGASVVYVPDHEPFHRKLCRAPGPKPPAHEAVTFAQAEDEKFVDFIRGADILIHDAQYDADEYRAHAGWGHSSVDDAVDLAIRGGVRQLQLFHHDPSHDDEKIDSLLEHARQIATQRGSSLHIEAAREGVTLALKHLGKS